MLEENIRIASFTTLGVGGPARFFARASSFSMLKRVNSFAKQKKLPLVVIGEGSNVLVSDRGIDGVVMKMEIKGKSWIKERPEEAVLEVSAGEKWDDVVKESVKFGFYGIENLSGIPGTAGAAPVQNIGAYGVEVSEVVSGVEAFDTVREKMVFFSKKECEFGYRKSVFKDDPGRFIVTSLTLRLSKSAEPVCSYKDIAEKVKDMEKSPDPQTMRRIVLGIREKKFPNMSSCGTAGSFFKNPIISSQKLEELKEKHPDIPFHSFDPGYFKVSLAWVLDKVLGIRGRRCGNVGLYENQPLVLVTYDNANASEVISFAEDIQERVLEKTGLNIEHEVVLL